MANQHETRSRSNIAITLAALAVIIPIALFILDLRTKEISIGVIARSPLVGVDDADLHGFEVLFKGETIDQVESLTLRFENSGDVPIEIGDYDGDIVIKFAEATSILSTALSGVTPESLTPGISSDANVLSVRPLLLNPGDQFLVSLFASGEPSAPEIIARIKGIQRVSLIPQKERRELHRNILKGGVGVLGVLLYFYLAGLLLFSERGAAKPRMVPRLDGVAVVLVAAIPGITLLVTTGYDVGLSSYQLFGAVMGVVLPGSYAMVVARRRVRQLKSSPDDTGTAADEDDDQDLLDPGCL